MAARFWLLAKILVAMVVLVIVVRKNDWDQTFQALKSANALYVLLGIASVTVAVGLSALRWREIITLIGHAPVSTKLALVGTFEGMFFNLFLPTGIGGDAARAYRAFDDSGSLKNAVFSSVIDRALGLAMLGLLLAAAALADASVRGLSIFPVLVLAGAALAAGALLAALIGRYAILPSKGRLERIWDLLRQFGNTVFSGRALLRLLPLLFLSTILNCVALWLFSAAVDLHLTLPEAVVVLEAASLAALVPISLGGWGVREGAIALLLVALSQPSGSSSAVSVLYAVGLLAVGLVGGAIWLRFPYQRASAPRQKAEVFPPQSP